MLNKLKKWLSNDSENPFPCDFTNKVLEYSNELGWQISINSEISTSISFDMGEGRSQLVLIFLSGEIAEQPIIQVSSPAAKLEDISDKMDQDFMNELLRLNSQTVNYGWAVETIEDDGDYLIAASDQMLNTMDVGELRSAVYAVAHAADEMEEKFGLDRF